MTENEFIKQNTFSSENSCSCNSCKKMCTIAPCMPTPSDILRIINNGFVDKLVFSGWAAGMHLGLPIIDYIGQKFKNNKCSFLTSDGLCLLHDLDIKPIEGKLAKHQVQIVKNVNNWLPYNVALTWKDPKNMKTIYLIYFALNKHLSNLKNNEK